MTRFFTSLIGALALVSLAGAALAQTQANPVSLGTFPENSLQEITLTTGSTGSIDNGSLPPGMYIQEMGGSQPSEIHDILSGQATAAGTYTFSISVPSSTPFGAPSDEWFTITISPTSIANGVYWDPTQGGSGWGIQFESAQGSNPAKIFVAGFGYTDDGKNNAMWIAATLYDTGNGTFAGAPTTCTGGNALTAEVASDQTPTCAAYQSPNGSSTLTVVLQTDTSAALSIGSRTANLVPFSSF